MLTIHAVSAASSTPGVSVGQTAHYTISGPDAGDTVDSVFTVSAVTGTNVTFTTVDVHLSGSNTTETVWVDIYSGPRFPSSLEFFLVAPGLTKGDLIYPTYSTSYSQLKIQDVNPAGSYGSAARSVVHLQASNTTSSTPNPTIEDFYWDQATGMFTEIVKKANGVLQLHVLMDSTSMWPADNPYQAFNAGYYVITLVSAGLVVIVIVGAIMIWRRKHH